MDLKDLVLGVMVSAVVLIVVAVPILGGLAGSSVVIMPDENNEGKTIYYRSLNSDGYTFDGLTIYRGNSTHITKITTSWTSEKTGETFELTYPISGSTQSENDVYLMAGDNIAIVLIGYYVKYISPNGNNLNPSVNSDLTVTATYNDSTSKWAINATGYIINYTLGSDGLVICPEEIAEYVGGTDLITEDRAMIFNTPYPPPGFSFSIMIQGEYSKDGGFSVRNTISITTLTIQGTPTITANVETDDHGLITIHDLETTAHVIRQGTEYVVNGYDYTIIVPYQPIIISEENGYTYLIWLLPVMMALVLIASVAYQIIPRRNTE